MNLPNYMLTIERYLKDKHPLIQVLIGPRQVGKTTSILSFLKNSPEGYLYFNADDTLISSSNWLEQCWQEALLKSTNGLLVIDEIQKVPDWTEKIKKLWDEQKRKKTELKVILLGSSSLELQQGVHESLTGRFELHRAYHWNFAESQKLKKMQLQEYLLYGGYPGSYQYIDDIQRWKKYITDSIIETVISKDILQQATVKDPALFRQIYLLLSAYPAQIVSYNKLLGQLQSKGNVEKIKYYIELLEKAFLFTKIEKFSTKKIITKSSSPKIIPMCPALSFDRSQMQDPNWLGRLFESYIGSELTKKDGDIYYWREGEKHEVDYIYRNGKNIFAIEVKSGRKKNPSGLIAFQKLQPQAKSIFITPENFEQILPSIE